MRPQGPHLTILTGASPWWRKGLPDVAACRPSAQSSQGPWLCSELSLHPPSAGPPWADGSKRSRTFILQPPLSVAHHLLFLSAFNVPLSLPLCLCKISLPYPFFICFFFWWPGKLYWFHYCSIKHRIGPLSRFSILPRAFSVPLPQPPCVISPLFFAHQPLFVTIISILNRLSSILNVETARTEMISVHWLRGPVCSGKLPGTAIYYLGML